MRDDRDLICKVCGDPIEAPDCDATRVKFTPCKTCIANAVTDALDKLTVSVETLKAEVLDAA